MKAVAGLVGSACFLWGVFLAFGTGVLFMVVGLVLWLSVAWEERL